MRFRTPHPHEYAEMQTFEGRAGLLVDAEDSPRTKSGKKEGTTTMWPEQHTRSDMR
jgi:hypothetical protein